MQSYIYIYKCENSFVDYKINYEKLCYSLRKILTDPMGQFNGSQLAKMKKVYFLQVTAIKFIGWKQLVYQFSFILNKLRFCEYVKFGAKSLKIDTLSITA